MYVSLSMSNMLLSAAHLTTTIVTNNKGFWILYNPFKNKSCNYINGLCLKLDLMLYYYYWNNVLLNFFFQISYRIPNIILNIALFSMLSQFSLISHMSNKNREVEFSNPNERTCKRLNGMKHFNWKVLSMCNDVEIMRFLTCWCCC